MEIAQISDLHIGEPLFDSGLLAAAIDEINDDGADTVVVAGDLTAVGLRHEFEQAHELLQRLRCPRLLCVPGNHDAMNAGHLHFEDVFGDRQFSRTLAGPGEVRIVGVDSTQPDRDDGQIGRDNYGWIAEALMTQADRRVVVVHHHLIAVPGTGRDKDILADAGDFLELLRALGVDLVLSGHRHVPHVWPVAGMFLVHSGTVATTRLRGYPSPSYNRVSLSAEELVVMACEPAGRRHLLAHYELPYGAASDRPAIEAMKVLGVEPQPRRDVLHEQATQTAGPRVGQTMKGSKETRR